MAESESVEAVVVARLAWRTVDPSELKSGAIDWSRVFELAARERCASLIWIRNAATIRALAPGDLAARWRGRTLAVGAAAREQVVELGDVLAALESSGVTPIVLKGLPLSQMLYGETSARPVSDVDLFVPVPQREAAHEALRASGFTHRFGWAPHEGAYERIRDGRRSVVEVHSSILDENALAHLQLPAPEGIAVDVDGTHVYAQSGPLLPLFLTMHLAKHAAVPLLWWIDLATVWGALTDAQRDATRRLARLHRVERYLEWGERGIALLAIATSGETPAAAEAMGALRDMHRQHQIRRLTALASGFRDMVASVLAWIWPRDVRSSPRAYARHVWHRVMRGAGKIRRGGAPDVTAAPSAELRGLAVSDEQLLDLVREVVSGGAPLWIRARGSSMYPTVKDGAMVRVGPLPQRPLRRGDVVLAVMRGGKAVIHRVLGVREGMVDLQGDNMPFPDAPVRREDVIALADVVQQDTRASAIPSRPPLNPRRILVRWRAAVRARRPRAAGA